ncbi:MAG: hypothetical protein ABSD42_06795 [Candidatus Bathyarchaeia archaeon]
MINMPAFSNFHYQEDNESNDYERDQSNQEIADTDCCFLNATMYVAKLVSPGKARPINGKNKSFTSVCTKLPK